MNFFQVAWFLQLLFPVLSGFSLQLYHVPCKLSRVKRTVFGEQFCCFCTFLSCFWYFIPLLRARKPCCRMALADSVKHARSWRRIVITFPSHICYIWSRDTLARRAAQNCVASVQKICYNEFANWYICPIFERRKQMNRQFPRLEVDASRDPQQRTADRGALPCARHCRLRRHQGCQRPAGNRPYI